MSIAYAYKMVLKREENCKSPDMPSGLFNVIYADPPWEYYLPLRGSPDMHYKTMSTEEICKLKVPAAEDAVLFLWATNPKLEDALKVMRAWGFTYKTKTVFSTNGDECRIQSGGHSTNPSKEGKACDSRRS
jgi:N6-adenosine-specific RNA methylase IME4